MRNFNLDKNDLKEIERLLKINTNINRLYTKLYTLEIEGKKDSDDYNKNIEYLSILIEGEDKIYSDPSLTTKKAISWAKFLFDQKSQNTFTQNKEKQEYNSIIIRIIDKLLSKIIKDYNTIINLSDREFTNIMTMLGLKMPDKVDRDTKYKCIILTNAIEKDIHYNFLSFLKKYIEDPKYRTLKKALIIGKYSIIFANKDIESYYLNNNFNIPDDTYIYSTLVAEALQIKPELYRNIKDVIGYKIVNEQINKLLEISNIEYNDIMKSAISIIAQCLMSSALLCMSDEKINDVNYEFHELIEDKEYSSVYPNSKVSESIIIELFKSIKKNKSKVQTISLK